jgi:RHS repeat-associated protein
MGGSRSFQSSTGYRYGFNGKENDNEVKGTGNQQDYGARAHDSRLGRFLSIDPMTRSFPFLSPYQYASNTPIQSIDLDGLEQFKISDKTVDYYNPATGEVTTRTVKSLTLKDVHAKFEVLDEREVSMNNFKYCAFQCQMEGYKVEQQTPSGDNSKRLSTPNINQSTKTSTENTFEITTLSTKSVEFIPVDLGGQFGSVSASTDFGDKLLNVGAASKQPGSDYNAYEAGKKASVIRIANGSELPNEKILQNLKDNGLVNDKAKIEFTTGEKGKVDIQFGNYSCPDCGAKTVETGGGSTGGSGGKMNK